MTLQEMITLVSGELHNTSIDTRITTWINLAVIELSSEYVFGTLHAYGSENTQAGVPDITLNSDLHWLKIIGIPAEGRNLFPKDESWCAERSPDYRTLQGQVSYYYLNNKTCGLFYVPASVIVVTYAYQREATDISDLPVDWHELIAQKAITRGHNLDGNSDDAVKSEAKEERIKTRLKSHLYRRLDVSHVLSGPEISGRPGRPVFPSNPMIPVP